MRTHEPAEQTSPETIEKFGDLADRIGDPGDAAQAWSEAGFGDETTAKWLEVRCFDPQAARALADMGVKPGQAGLRTRDGGDGSRDTIGYKVANGDLTARQGAARCMSSR